MIVSKKITSDLTLNSLRNKYHTTDNFLKNKLGIVLGKII